MKMVRVWMGISVCVCVCMFSQVYMCVCMCTWRWTEQELTAQDKNLHILPQTPWHKHIQTAPNACRTHCISCPHADCVCPYFQWFIHHFYSDPLTHFLLGFSARAHGLTEYHICFRSRPAYPFNINPFRHWIYVRMMDDGTHPASPHIFVIVPFRCWKSIERKLMRIYIYYSDI